MKNQAIIRALLLLLPALQLKAAVRSESAASGVGTPTNFVIILADDLGVGDVQCLNPLEGKIPTPRLDHLAGQSMIFSNAHSSSALCSPSRYSIMTGRYAWRTRLRSGVLVPYDPPLIAADRLTLPELFKQRGYETACIGKWHLGWDWPKTDGKVDFTQAIAQGPTTRGFDYYFGTDVPNYPPYCFIENDRTVGQPTAWKVKTGLEVSGIPGPMLPGWNTEEILPTIADRAVRYIAERAGDKKPFFLYVPLTSPHEPVAPTKQWQGKSGISSQADFIMETDDVVGQIDRALEARGLAGNTLLIFTADNGHNPFIQLEALLEHGHHPSGPYRGYKWDIWDGGHHEPFLIRWPGKVQPGSICPDMICLSDLMATSAEILGTKLPDNAGEDSVSFLPDLLGTARGPVRKALVHQGGAGGLAIREGRWKLECCPGSNGQPGPPNIIPIKDHWTDAEARKMGLPPVQLYDMEADVGETNNVEAAHPEIVARLMKLLEKYITDGRSTPGAAQKNDIAVPLFRPPNVGLSPAGVPQPTG